VPPRFPNAFGAVHKSEDTDTHLTFHKGHPVLGTMFWFGPGANDSNEMLFRVAQQSLNVRLLNMSSVASYDFGDTLCRIFRTFSDHVFSHPPPPPTVNNKVQWHKSRRGMTNWFQRQLQRQVVLATIQSARAAQR